MPSIFFLRRASGKDGGRLWRPPYLAIALVLLWSTLAHAAIPPEERQVLLDIYADTNGAGWTSSTGWNGAPGTECSWFGIICGGTPEHVYGIDLPNNRLGGSFPHVGALSELRALKIFGNQISGPLPSPAGLTHLQFYDVSVNRFTGTIPAIAGSPTLFYFNVGGNKLGGSLPDLSGLPGLNSFLAYGDHLSGSIPSFAGAPQLAVIDIDSNDLTGSIPSLTSLTSLFLFNVGSNHLSGSIPSLSGLSRLSIFYVYSNSLTGPIPSFAGLIQLQNVDLSNNALSGNVPDLSGLGQLQRLVISRNQLSGTMPSPPSPGSLVAGLSQLCPNGLNHDDNTGWDAATGITPWWRDCAPNGPPIVVTGTAQSGNSITFTAAAGGSFYEWDVDGDNVTDRSGTSNTLPVTYPGDFNGVISVTVTSAGGSRTITKQPLAIVTPHLSVTVTGAPTELCGNGDGIPQPGKRFSVPIKVTNDGLLATAEGYATFVAQDRLDAANFGQGIAGKMQVETPLVGVGNLASGASINAEAIVTLASDAACGAAYGLVFRGGVDLLSSGPGQSAPISNFFMPSGAQCQPYTGTCAALPKALVTPRQGLYLNPNRSGNGLSNFIIPVSGSAPVYFGAWFTGATNHNPTWYIIQGPLVGNVVVAPILRFTRDVSASTFSVSSSVVGTAIVSMKSTERIAFTWQIGERFGIELMDYFVGGAAPVPNRTGAWFNTGESGWGQVIHAYVAGGQDNLFIVDYIYDGTGQPRWVLGQATPSTFASPTPHQTFQVHCPGCPWIADWNSFPVATGSGSETFSDSTHGVANTAFVLPAPFANTWNRANLPITLLTVPQ